MVNPLELFVIIHQEAQRSVGLVEHVTASAAA
jgi:hypothetical protein